MMIKNVLQREEGYINQISTLCISHFAKDALMYFCCLVVWFSPILDDYVVVCGGVSDSCSEFSVI